MCSPPRKEPVALLLCTLARSHGGERSYRPTHRPCHVTPTQTLRRTTKDYALSRRPRPQRGTCADSFQRQSNVGAERAGPLSDPCFSATTLHAPSAHALRKPRRTSPLMLARFWTKRTPLRAHELFCYTPVEHSSACACASVVK